MGMQVMATLDVKIVEEATAIAKKLDISRSKLIERALKAACSAITNGKDVLSLANFNLRGPETETETESV